MQTQSSRSYDDRPLVLVADRNQYYRSYLQTALSRECSIATLHASNVLEAIRRIEQNPRISVVIAEVDFPRGPDGKALLETVHRRWPQVKRVVLSGELTGSLVMHLDADVVIDKRLPWFEITGCICGLTRKAS